METAASSTTLPIISAKPGMNITEVRLEKSKVRTKDVTIFITVDNSGSMANAKIKQVIESVKLIIDKVPPYGRFHFRRFADDVQGTVSKKKSQLDIDRAMNDINKVGGQTALYDAWGTTLEQISFDLLRSRTDNIYVLIFTDGEDNVSKKFTLTSVIDLLREKLKCNHFYFTFIQAGSEQSPAVRALLEQFSSCPRCKVLTVADSAEGIAFAFEKVRQQIEVVVKIKVDNPGYSKEDVTINPINQGSTRVRESNGNSRGSRQGGRSFPRDQGSYHNRNKQDDETRLKSHFFNLKVQNIPLNAKPEVILEQFSMAGSCHIIGMGTEASSKSQWLILCYSNEAARDQTLHTMHETQINGRPVRVTKSD